MTGPLIIVSGPSGSGKSTIIQRLLAEKAVPLRLSISATTRGPRKGEQDSREYHFWTRERFQKEIADDGFLEWAEVFGNYYGTPRSEVEPFRAEGQGVILDIDVQGAAQVRAKCPDVVSIFLHPSSLEALRERLEKRGTETPEAIARRLEGAKRELARMDEYEFKVLNDDLEQAVADVRAIVWRQFNIPGLSVSEASHNK